MPQDAFTLRYLCEELNAEFTGGKINRIVQPTAEEVVFTVYTGKATRKLYISVNPSCPRIGVISEDRESPLTAPNFCMLLRKHLLSATVDGVSLVGFDRIVRINFTASSEFFDAGRKTLFVELMGRYSNVILTENGKVLGGNRGVNFFDNGVRPLIVGRDYVLPPTNDKKTPDDESLYSYFARFDGAVCSMGERSEELSAELSAAIFKGVQGIAADTAREIADEYYKSHAQFSSREFVRFLNDFVYKTVKNPCVLTENGEVKDVCVYPYGVLGGEVKSFACLSEAEDFFFNEKDKIKLFRSKKERVTAVVSSAVKKVKKRLSAINARLSDAQDAETDKIKGELILSNIYRLKQGDKECTLLNYYDGTEMKIALDAALTPAQNAARYYKKYNKAKRTLAAQQPQKDAALKELDYLNAVADEIDLAETAADVSLIKDELVGAGLINEPSAKNRRRKQPAKYRTYVIDGFTVKAGRNNVENDELTFSAKGGDVWLHAKDYHSSHLIIETNGKEVGENVIIAAAEICAYYSKGRNGGKTEIVYTKKKFVRKPTGSRPGFCVYTDFKSVTVMPDAHERLIKRTV